MRKRGRIYTHSRWVSHLPDRVDSRPVDIYYSTFRPFISDILFQQSFLLSFKTWSETPETFYWMKWSFADKPTNRLYYVLNKSGVIKIGEEKGSAVFADQGITILPVRERILSTEWGLDYKELSIIFSLENTKIKEDLSIRPEDWEFVNLRGNFTYFSLLLKYNYLKDSFVQLGFIQSWFKNYNIYKESKEKPAILLRSKVLEGVGLDWQTKLLSCKKQPVFLSLKYQYSFLDQGAWLFGKISYYMTPEIYTELTVDILGATEWVNGKDIRESTFLNSFKHNDYFTWSLVYDF